MGHTAHSVFWHGWVIGYQLIHFYGRLLQVWIVERFWGVIWLWAAGWHFTYFFNGRLLRLFVQSCQLFKITLGNLSIFPGQGCLRIKFRAQSHRVIDCFATLAQLNGLRIDALRVGWLAVNLPSLCFRFWRVGPWWFLYILNLDLFGFWFGYQFLLDPGDLLGVFLFEQLTDHVVFQVVALKHLRWELGVFFWLGLGLGWVQVEVLACSVRHALLRLSTGY